MDEDERVELIGELAPMSAKGIHREALKVALIDHWVGLRSRTCVVAPETTFRLLDDTFLEPDFVIYPRASRLKSLSQSNVLLVVEIADCSLGYDRGRKAALYASFGVRELWVIDAVERATRVFRKLSAAGYGETLDFGESDLSTPEFASPNWRCGSTNSSRSSSRGGDAGHGAKSPNRRHSRGSQAVATASVGARPPKRRSRRRKSAITPAKFAGVKSGHIASRNANSA